jgi:hypothetical protein
MADGTGAPTRLNEDALTALQAKYKKIAVVDWNEHQIVFRRPTRDECRSYRIALEAPATKADAAEQLCQFTIVAFDAETDPTRARVTFTTVLLEECPMFSATTKVKVAIGALMGLVEEEDLADLGKGVSVRPWPRRNTPTG